MMIALRKKATTPFGISVSVFDLAWHAPDLEVQDVIPEEIVLIFTDNSYDDVSYSMSRQEEGSATWVWLLILMRQTLVASPTFRIKI